MTFKVFDNKTGKYPDMEQIALNEEWAMRLKYCDMQEFAILENGMLVLTNECGFYTNVPVGRFSYIVTKLDKDERTNIL